MTSKTEPFKLPRACDVTPRYTFEPVIEDSKIQSLGKRTIKKLPALKNLQLVALNIYREGLLIGQLVATRDPIRKDWVGSVAHHRSVKFPGGVNEPYWRIPVNYSLWKLP